MSLYWSVNKNMEIIKNIKEVSDVYFNNDKWDTYDGYCIETDSRKLYFVINEDEDVTIRQNALQCIYELTNKILDMQVKDKYLNPIVVDINQK